MCVFVYIYMYRLCMCIDLCMMVFSHSHNKVYGWPVVYSLVPGRFWVTISTRFCRRRWSSKRPRWCGTCSASTAAVERTPPSSKPGSASMSPERQGVIASCPTYTWTNISIFFYIGVLIQLHTSVELWFPWAHPWPLQLILMPHSSRLFFTFAMRNTPCRESYRAHRGPLGPQIQDAQAKDRVQQSAARFQARSGRAHSSGVHRICFSKGLPFQTDKAFAKGKWLNLQVWFIWISFYIIIFFWIRVWVAHVVMIFTGRGLKMVCPEMGYTTIYCSFI